MTRTNDTIATLLAALVLASSVPATVQPPAPTEFIDPDLKWALPAPPGQCWLSLATGDIDHDGLDEVIAGTGNALYALDGATGLPLWRVPVGFVVHLEVTDLDGDGALEVVTTSSQVPLTGVQWTVRVHDARTGMLRGLYHGSVPDGAIGELKTADLTGDSIEDIVISTYEWDPPGFNGVLALDGKNLMATPGVQIVGDEALLWTYEVGNFPGMRPQNIEAYIRPGTTISVVYFVDPNGELHAINGSSGERIWLDRDSARIVQVANITGDQYPEIMINGGDVEVFEPLTGERIKTLDPQAFSNANPSTVGAWIQPIDPSQKSTATLAVHGIGTLDNESYSFLWGLDAERETLEWTVNLGRYGSTLHPPRLQAVDMDRDDNSELVLSEGDNLYIDGWTPDTFHRPRVLVIDTIEGRILWEHWMPSQVAWRFDTGDLDGEGTKEIVVSAEHILMAWEPTLEDRGAQTDRGSEQARFRTGSTCMMPG